jgi:hypothetical protein
MTEIYNIRFYDLNNDFQINGLLAHWSMDNPRLGDRRGDFEVILQRCWEWNDESSLNNGTKDSNINITNGDIRLEM